MFLGKKSTVINVVDVDMSIDTNIVEKSVNEETLIETNVSENSSKTLANR